MTTPASSPASALRDLLSNQVLGSSSGYPSSPRSTTEPTQHGSLKRRLTTARLLALPREPPYTVKTASTLDAVISSGLTGPSRIMAEMRLRGFNVDKRMVQRAIRKWKTREKTVQRLEQQGMVAGKGLAGKSVVPDNSRQLCDAEGLEKISSDASSQLPAPDDGSGEESLSSDPLIPFHDFIDDDQDLQMWEPLSLYFE